MSKCAVCGKIEEVGLEYVTPDFRANLCSRHFNMATNEEWDKLNEELEKQNENNNQ